MTSEEDILQTCLYFTTQFPGPRYYQNGSMQDSCMYHAGYHHRMRF